IHEGVAFCDDGDVVGTHELKQPRWGPIEAVRGVHPSSAHADPDVHIPPDLASFGPTSFTHNLRTLRPRTTPGGHNDAHRGARGRLNQRLLQVSHASHHGVAPPQHHVPTADPSIRGSRITTTTLIAHTGLRLLLLMLGLLLLLRPLRAVIRLVH